MVYSSSGFDPVGIKKLLDALYYIYQVYEELVPPKLYQKNIY
jgi:hypothetical protein